MFRAILAYVNFKSLLIHCDVLSLKYGYATLSPEFKVKFSKVGIHIHSVDTHSCVCVCRNV